MPRCSSSSITFRRDGDDEIHREPGARGSRRRSSRGSSESELVVRSIAVGGQPAPAQKSRDLALCIRPSPHKTVGTSHSVTRPRLYAMDCLPRVEVRSVVAGAPRTRKGASLSGGQHRCRGVGYQPASHSRAPLRSTGRQALFFDPLARTACALLATRLSFAPLDGPRHDVSTITRLASF